MIAQPGFVGFNTSKAEQESALISRRSSSIFIGLLDGSNRNFWLEGSACPTEPITLSAKQKTNVITYPGIDGAQVQVCGFSYDPITIKGTVDAVHLQRGLGNIKTQRTTAPIDVATKVHAITTTTSEADLIVSDVYSFFDQLREAHAEGHPVLFSYSIHDPAGITSARSSSDFGKSLGNTMGTVGYLEGFLRCVISDVTTSDMVFGVTGYSITLQPIGLVGVTNNTPETVYSSKSALGKMKDFAQSVNAAMETLEDITNTIDDYYNTYIHNSLAALQGTMEGFTDLTQGYLNVANLPANAIQQVVALAYSVKTNIESLATNALAVGSRYKTITNIDMEWDGPTVSDGDKAFAIDPVQIAIQASYLRAGIGFAPDYDTTVEGLNVSGLSNEAPDIQSFNVRLEQTQKDRYLRDLVAPIAIAAKRIRDKFEAVANYTSYICQVLKR